jgi:protein-arginine kinase activator protein McsA
MHKGVLHMGKQAGTGVDANGQIATKIMSLQKELDIAVKKEEYEKAAELRDSIIQLKKGNRKDKKKNRAK